MGHTSDGRHRAALSDAVEHHPAADRDEEDVWRIALVKQAIARPQHDRHGGCDDVLDHLGVQATDDGNACDDLQVAGAEFAAHAGSPTVERVTLSTDHLLGKEIVGVQPDEIW
jgi:hypothetical protein